MTRQGRQEPQGAQIPSFAGAVAGTRPGRRSGEMGGVLSLGRHPSASALGQVAPTFSLLGHRKAPDSASPSVADLIERMDSATPEAESDTVFHGVATGLFMHVNGDEAGCLGAVRPEREVMPYKAEIFDTDPPDLVEALGDLQTAPIEADGLDFPLPETGTLMHAEKVLRRLYEIVPRLYYVYPMDPGDIAIDAPGANGQSAIFYCYPDESVYCCVNLRGNVVTTVCKSLGDFPDPRVRDALVKMEKS